MDTHLNEESEEDERQRLLLFSSAKVVEYLEPIMSRELLSKFPDKTAFGFDYSQSSIWSPLVPRTYNAAASSSSMDLGSITPKKLWFGFGMDVGGKGKMSVKKLMSSSTTKKKKKKKMSSPVFKINPEVVKNKSKMKMKMRASQFSATPIKNSCVPFSAKGWHKVLKAASKRFKKKKADPPAHVKLSDYLKIGKN